MKLEFSRQIFFKPSHMKISPVVVEFFRANGRTNRQTDMTKLFATLRKCLRIKGPDDVSLTLYIRSSVWYINIGYLHSSVAAYRTIIYDWINAVSPPTPLLLVGLLNTQTSGRSFPEPPSGRLQGKIMSWRRLRYHIKSQSPPVKNGASTETVISSRNPFKKNTVPSRTSIFSREIRSYSTWFLTGTPKYSRIKLDFGAKLERKRDIR